MRFVISSHGILKSQHKEREDRNSKPPVSWSRVLEMVTGTSESVSQLVNTETILQTRMTLIESDGIDT